MAEKSPPVAFIYYAGKVYTGSAHWRIIEDIWQGDIAEFLYLSLETLDLAWGWLWATGDISPTGAKEVVVEFYTEIAPHHQSTAAFPAAIDALQKELKVEVIDMETPEPPPGILQRFTPTGIQQSVPTPTDYNQKYKPLKDDGPAEGWDAYVENYEQNNGIKKDNGLKIVSLKRTTVPTPDGKDIEVSTIDARGIPGDSNYETLVVGGGMDGSLFPSDTSDNALRTHENIVQLVADFENGKFDDGQSDHKFFSHVAASKTHDCFGVFNNKIYFGNSHHEDIIDRIMYEEGYDWEDFFEKPSLFGWYYKPNKTYFLSTDSSAPQDESLEQTTQQLLEATYGKGVHKADLAKNPNDYVMDGWEPDHTPRPPDLSLKDIGVAPSVKENPDQLKITSSFDDDAGHVMDAPGLSVIKTDPPAGATHSQKEKPFIYYRPTHTLFETTSYCHHENVLPQIYELIEKHTGTMDLGPNAWVMGDITDPDTSGQNWIKFIHPGPIPNSVVQYFKGEYPDRTVIYNTDNGWERLPDEAIDKTAVNQKAMGNGSGAFGYVNGYLILASTHHQAIMAALLQNGWTWEHLFTVPQAWGWWTVHYNNSGTKIDEVWVRFTSDAGTQTANLDEVRNMIGKELGYPAVDWPNRSLKGISDIDNYGRGLSGINNIDNYLNKGPDAPWIENYIHNPIPSPPVEEKPRPDWLPEGLHMVPTSFPPPRQSSTIRDMEGVLPYGQESGFDGCFGYLEDTDTLYLGDTHHAAIIAQLVEEGMSWETLMGSRQMWGWCDSATSTYDYSTGTSTPLVQRTIGVRFATDEARQDKGIKPKVLSAFKQAFPTWKISLEGGYGYKSQEGYGERAKEQYLDQDSDDEELEYDENGMF